MEESVKQKLYLIAILFIFSFSITAQPLAPDGWKWEKVQNLSDEFKEFDNSKWEYSLWNYPPPNIMMESQAWVEDGKLCIKAEKHTDSIRWMKTCRIMSKTQISYPMYTECRMKTADISAYTTYWLNNGNARNRDEIDICENVSNPAKDSMAHWAYTMQSQYFIVKNNETERNKGDFDNRGLSDTNLMKGVKWNTYHTLGMWWKDKNNIQFYINGEEAGSVTTKQDFTRDLNIIWDLWTSPEKWFCGLPDKSDLENNTKNTMFVDWVHTYKLVPEN